MSGTSSDEVQQAAAVAGGGGGGGAAAVPSTSSPAPAGGGGGGGGGTAAAQAAAAAATAAAIAQEGSDGLGALKGSMSGTPSGSPFRGSPRGGPTLTRSQTLGPNATGLDDKRDRSGLGRVFNPPKLERKHSSGDLHSRLKTRKILGVGETDNGDIHRSKISQVLGHNEHLYVKLPRGFWSAHVAMGVGVTLEAALLLLAPSLAAQVGVMPPLEDDVTGACRVAGAALAGLCVFVWSLLGTSDKHYARTMLLSMLTYHLLSICVSAAAAFSLQEAAVTGEQGEREETEEVGDGGDSEDDDALGGRRVLFVGVRAVMCLLCLAYFYSIG